MKTIRRYTLGKPYHNSTPVVDLPKGAKIISCQWHEMTDGISIWAIVNPKHQLKEREFHIFGSGFDLIDYDKKHYEFISTVQEKDVNTWHIFEVYK